MNPLRALFLATSILFLLVANAVAQTRTLYFYPPDDTRWLAGRSYISNGSTTTALELEPNKCGWYKATFSDGTTPSVSQFFLGKSGLDKIGPNGRLAIDFDENVDFASEGGVFRLGEIFSRLGNNVYFVADELDPSNPDAGWSASDPDIEDPSRCRFELAAFIYDTDPAVHPDFSCGTYMRAGTTECPASGNNGPDTKCTCDEAPQAYSGAGGNLKGQCIGVVKGLVKPNLDPQTRKIEYSGTDPKKCWTSADWFSKAFTSTPDVNVEHCYNMPFTQVKTGTAAGSFEFDSDNMLNANNRLVGGFFPELLNSAPADATCPSCNTKRSADRFPARVREITKEIFGEYQSKEGDFKDGDTPTRSTFNVTVQGYPGCEWVSSSDQRSIYDWCVRNATATVAANNPNWSDWFLHGNTALKNTYGESSLTIAVGARANQHFCFESHAEFYYDPAQVFYFSGDDDIWVYINNKLVIDLGGAHMAAPGHVNLNTLGLTEGVLYPIDIFFCDRRTVQSNVRISTNMYIAQKSNFYNDMSRQDNKMCASVQQGADCASKMGMGGASSEMCGTALTQAGYMVEFYMVKRGNRKDTTFLSPSKNSGNCSGTSSNNFTCYDGIKVVDAVYSCGGRGQCKSNVEAIEKVNVAGNFNVYARLLNSSGVVQGKPILIDSFGSEASPIVIDSESFYMINRNNTQDTIWLSAAKNPNNCNGTGANNFQCYGGIKVIDAVYSCGGFDKCEGNAVATSRINITGNFDVYARLMQDDLLGELLLIDNINSDVSPILPRFLPGSITARAIGNAIVLENLPANAKVEVYNLQGKQVYSTTSHSPLATSHLRILVQTKGIYMLKVSLGSEKMILKIPSY